jgi:hypothetical protein
MKSLYHARSSARQWGGVAGDYLEIHDFIDSSKEMMADVRHRALLHSATGIYMVEKVFGKTMEVPKKHGRGVLELSVRDVAERHIMEDIGRIPSMQDWFDNMQIQPWMGGKKGKVREFTWAELGWNTEESFDRLEDGLKVEHELLKD